MSLAALNDERGIAADKGTAAEGKGFPLLGRGGHGVVTDRHVRIAGDRNDGRMIFRRQHSQAAAQSIDLGVLRPAGSVSCGGVVADSQCAVFFEEGLGVLRAVRPLNQTSTDGLQNQLLILGSRLLNGNRVFRNRHALVIRNRVDVKVVQPAAQGKLGAVDCVLCYDDLLVLLDNSRERKHTAACRNCSRGGVAGQGDGATVYHAERAVVGNTAAQNLVVGVIVRLDITRNADSGAVQKLQIGRVKDAAVLIVLSLNVCCAGDIGISLQLHSRAGKTDRRQGGKVVQRGHTSRLYDEPRPCVALRRGREGDADLSAAVRRAAAHRAAEDHLLGHTQAGAGISLRQTSIAAHYTVRNGGRQVG